MGCRAGREAIFSGAIIASRAAKTTEKGGVRGYDGGKKVSGRKRSTGQYHRVIRVAVHEANAVDRDGAKLLLVKVGERLSRMRRVWAGRGYNGKLGE